MGLDPGSRITGYGILERRGRELGFVACGVIKSTPALAFPLRIKEIHDGVRQVIETHGPQLAAVEDIFLAKNPSSALKLGQARGAILIAALSLGLAIHEFSARQVKQAVTGYGQAAKGQVQHMVRTLLALSADPSPDAADALAVALCLGHHLNNTVAS
ncbi:MAG: crossover junction endodeoxyribonuclease RuvC [Desulfobacteraceae bacterium]|nr:crossover junction endodeoxyribonuclease RuvC [Desulfobacteraceae bacterium]